MTEILTESFCERCGTRYTFESSAPRQKRLGGLKVLGRGFKNFVMSDDSSLDEAFAAARSDAERDATAHQLDAFHKTFNFCMSCRQYTCANCWNELEARCLSCAPLAADESLPVFEADSIDPERLLRFMGGPTTEAPAAGEEPVAADHGHVSELIGDEIHEAHLRAEAHEAEIAEIHDAHLRAEAVEAEAAAAAVAEAEAAAESEGAPAVEAEAAMEEAAGAEATALAEAPLPVGTEAAEEPAHETIEAAPEMAVPALDGIEPGQSLDDAIAAYEASLATEAYAAAGEPAAVAETLAAPAEPEPVAAAEPLEEPVAAPEPVLAEADVSEAEAPEPIPAVVEPELAVVEPEPVMAEPEPVVAEPEPVAAEPEPIAAAAEAQPVGPAVEPAPEEAASKPAGVDVIDQPVWPAAAAPATEAPVAPAPAAQPAPPAAPASPAEPPSWPTGPRWPTSIPARSAPPPPMPDLDPLTALMARSSTDAMWAASNRDVLQPIAAATVAAVQPCVKCGISLSATARFCRRCGTPQG